MIMVVGCLGALIGTCGAGPVEVLLLLAVGLDGPGLSVWTATIAGAVLRQMLRRESGIFLHGMCLLSGRTD